MLVLNQTLKSGCLGRRSSIDAAAWAQQKRFFGVGTHHQYRTTHVKTEQTDGVDHYLKAKGDSQTWLHTEQWGGYSDSFLKRHVQYTPSLMCNGDSEPIDGEFECMPGPMFKLIFKEYGAAATILDAVEENPLHPDFHRLLSEVAEHTKAFEQGIDKLYPDAHPTLKLLYDAWLVRRLHVLEDWIILVKRKRSDTLARLLEYDPTGFILEEVKRCQGIADGYIGRLERLGNLWREDPMLMVEQCDSIAGLNDEEKVAIANQFKFRSKMKQWGLSKHDTDVRPL